MTQDTSQAAAADVAAGAAAAPRPRVVFLHGGADPSARWLEPFMPAAARARYAFDLVHRDEKLPSWHERGGTATLAEWRNAFAYARKGLRGRPDAIVTTFPQTALAACAIKRVLGLDTRIVGWAFNLGSIENRLKGRGAGALLRAADALIVHSREEVLRYGEWLRLPPGILRFEPLQCGRIDLPREEAEPPYALAMGTAKRDYATLFEAVAGWPGRLIVVAGPSAVEGLTPPPNTELRSGLPYAECQALLARAAVSIVPIDNQETASGQLTFLQSMTLGVPVIATDCPGTRDYMSDGKDALLVPPRDPASLRAALDRLWNDEGRRRALGEAGRQRWEDCNSDEAAGRALARVLDDVLPAA